MAPASLLPVGVPAPELAALYPEELFVVDPIARDEVSCKNACPSASRPPSAPAFHNEDVAGHAPELSSLFRTRRRWLLILYLDFLEPLLEQARKLLRLGPAVVVDARRDGYLVGEGPGYLAPLPLWRHVDRLVLEEYAVLRRPGARPDRPEERLLGAEHLDGARGEPRHPLEPPRPRDEPRPYRRARDLCDVGRDLVHGGVHRLCELLPLGGGLDGQLREADDAAHVPLRDGPALRLLRGEHDRLRLLVAEALLLQGLLVERPPPTYLDDELRRVRGCP